MNQECVTMCTTKGKFRVFKGDHLLISRTLGGKEYFVVGKIREVSQKSERVYMETGGIFTLDGKFSHANWRILRPATKKEFETLQPY